MNVQTGRFIVIEGPSGIGKSTVARLLHGALLEREQAAILTREPSDQALGQLARHGTHEYHGVALACLVAADRYHHLENTIRPSLRDGLVVICDRYVPTSLVLQRLDGVDPDFVLELNRYAEPPDLTIILLGDPERSARRAADRGVYSRFHDGGQAMRARESELYRDSAHQLGEAGWAILELEIGDEDAAGVVSSLLPEVLERLSSQA